MKPNLFIIGAPKSGTTGFVESLRSHPEIFVPRNKEPRYFDAHVFYDYPEDYPIKNLDDYLSLYSSKESTNSLYRVDGSVFNMYSVDSIKQILAISPKAKFVVILRDPLEATKSMFLQRMKYTDSTLREVSEDFNTCWQLMKSRKNNKNFPDMCRNKFIFRYDLIFSYELYLNKIVELVGKENIYLGSYELFLKQPDSFYSSIFTFLGLDKNFKIENKIKNKSYIVKNNTKNKLISKFSSSTKEFRSKLGLDGNRINFIKKVFKKDIEVEIAINNESDEDIKNYFRKTYQYLESNNINVSDVPIQGKGL